MKSCILALMLILAASTSGLTQHSPNLAEAGALYALGDSLYEGGKYKLASDTLKRAIDVFVANKDLSGQIKAQHLYGECFANLAQCDKAIEILQATFDLALANFTEKDPEVAQSYYYLSRAKGGCARKYDEALVLMNKSNALKKTVFGKSSPELASNYTFQGYMLNNVGQHDSAIAYLDKALKIRLLQSIDTELECSHIYSHLGVAYRDKGDLNKALDFQLRSLSIRERLLGQDHATVSNSITLVGGLYQRFGNFDRALDYYQKGLEIRKRTLGPDHTNVAGSYYTIGNLYSSMLDHHQAIQYIQQGNRITEKTFHGENDILATYYAFIGKLYGLTGEHVMARDYLNKAQVMGEKILKKDHPYLAIIYNILGEYHTDAGDLIKARSYFSRAISIYHIAYGPASVREGDVYAKLGSGFITARNFDEGMKAYAKALEIYSAKLGRQNPKVAAIHQGVGKAWADQGNFDEALTAYQQALAAISSDSLTDVYVNPRAEKIESALAALKIARDKADVLLRIAKSKSAPLRQDFERAMETYDFAMELIGSLASGYNNQSGRIELEKLGRSIFNNAIHTTFALFTLSRDERYVERGFRISEQSKSALLLENMKDDRAKMMAGVPDSLVAKERDLKIELAYHKANLYQAQKNNATESIAVHEKNIFDTGQRIQQVKDDLETRFPSYYYYKYARVQPDLAQVRKKNDDHNGIIEFFVADTTLYRFAVTAKEVQFSRIKKDEYLQRLVADYERSLTNAAFILNARDSADRMFTRSAYGLYAILLKPVLDEHPEVDRLTIIPDDFLAQINFSTLLSEKNSSDVAAVDLPFLIRRIQVSYAYSSLFMDDTMVKRKNRGDAFGGFAPSYTGNPFAAMDTSAHAMAYLVMRDGTLPLPGAQEEVKRISAFMGGEAWLDKDATETNFKKHAGEYGILHLAMHSLLDNQNPDFSELLFNPRGDDSNDGFLNVAEIYNLDLNAELVVLSACSSGYGKIQTGEGPITLSRAFSYAGCPSVVMSLWKVPDAITTQIMTNFYEELMDGKAKDEALRLAQTRFLSESDDPLYHHPYFWAGFVVMGDTSPIPQSKPWWVVLTGIVGGLVIATIAFIRKRKKKLL